MKIIFLFTFLIFKIQSETKCDSKGPGFFKFFAKTQFYQKENGKKYFTSNCFQQVEVEFYERDNVVSFFLTGQKKTSYFCAELIYISSGKHTQILPLLIDDLQILAWFDLKKFSKEEQNYIKKRGFKIMKSCDNLFNFPQDLINVVKLFLGGLATNPYIPIFGSKVPSFMREATINLVEQIAEYKLEKREKFFQINYPKEKIKNGDVFLIYRMDGINGIIQIGSGSRVGHSTLAMWKEKELYICESRASMYFPVNGIKCNKWEDWLIWSKNADLNIIILPLKKELSEKFDEKKAWKFIEGVLDTDYGFQNFFLGWIDTIDKNYPDIFDPNFIFYLSSLFEKIFPDVLDKFLYQALNKRLNTENLKYDDIWEEIYKKDTTLEQLLAIPEQESWFYKGKKSYTCSSLVIAVMKAAGLFGEMEINATEFTPKDLYELNFYEEDKIVEECKNYMEDGYCQIMGEMHLKLGKTNFVEPYAHMDEKCPSKIPDFEREKNCQFNK